MKLFLVFLFVASCQASPFFRIPDYKKEKEVELKKLVKVAKDEIFKALVTEYHNKDSKLLVALNNQIPVLIKHAFDTVLAPIDKGSIMAFNMTHNMWRNVMKIAKPLNKKDSVTESVKKFLADLKRDVKAMKQIGVPTIGLLGKFVRKTKYGALDRRKILGNLNDTVHRIVGHVSGKFSDSKGFFHIKIRAEKLEPHLINIYKLAQDLLTYSDNFIKDGAMWAHRFFGHFNNKSGDLAQTIKTIQEILDCLQTDQRQTC